jgi:hypothetical protein
MSYLTVGACHGYSGVRANALVPAEESQGGREYLQEQGSRYGRVAVIEVC